MDDWPRYRDAARRLVIAYSEGTAPQPEDVATVRELILHELRNSSLREPDREDVVSETLLRLLSALRAGRVDPQANVAGFVRIVARHCAYDIGRSAASEQRGVQRLKSELVDLQALSDDEIASLLNAQASA